MISRRSPEQGFTLIETLVVLAIVGLVLALVPPVFAGLSGNRLRAAADEVVLTLREARSSAIRTGNTIELVLDPTRRIYGVSGEARVRALPAVVQRFDAAPLADENGLVHIRFFPDGSATEGQVWLRSGRQSTRITIDWLTGLARRDG